MSSSGGSGDLPIGASAAQGPPLRRGLLGYRREDVHRALDSRDAELAELRQDVAALWLAFGQHDRMIRAALDRGVTASTPPHPAGPPATETAPARAGGSAPAAAREVAPAPTPAREIAPAPAGAEAAPAGPSAPAEQGGETEVADSITRQLSELDDVLAAIETATESLERSYAEEIAPADRAQTGVDASTGVPSEPRPED